MMHGDLFILSGYDEDEGRGTFAVCWRDDFWMALLKRNLLRYDGLAAPFCPSLALFSVYHVEDQYFSPN